MKRIRKIAAMVLGVVILLGTLVGLWFGIAHFLQLLAAANPEISAAIIGAMATVLIGVGAAILTHRSARLRAIEEAHRERKVEIYRQFLEIIARQLANENENVKLKPLKPAELINFLVGFKSDIMLWGSPKVINAFREFSGNLGSGDARTFKVVDDLYRAIREDIGLSNKGLAPYTLVKMYLSDPAELDALVSANKSLNTDASKAGAG